MFQVAVNVSNSDAQTLKHAARIRLRQSEIQPDQIRRTINYSAKSEYLTKLQHIPKHWP
jgi:hypothetical protein